MPRYVLPVQSVVTSYCVCRAARRCSAFSRTDVFYTKFIDSKGEGNGAHFVLPKSGCVACWSVAKGGKDLDKLVVGKNVSLGQTVHAAANFTKHVSATYDCMKVIFIHDFLGQRPNWDLHIFVS